MLVWTLYNLCESAAISVKIQPRQQHPSASSVVSRMRVCVCEACVPHYERRCGYRTDTLEYSSAIELGASVGR